MIGAVGEVGAAAVRGRPVDAGNSAQAVGQQAKAAVEAARSAGTELPKNAQGIAASGIARGADPASLFAAKVTPPGGGETDQSQGDGDAVVPDPDAGEDVVPGSDASGTTEVADDGVPRPPEAVVASGDVENNTSIGVDERGTDGFAVQVSEAEAALDLLTRESA